MYMGLGIELLIRPAGSNKMTTQSVLSNPAMQDSVLEHASRGDTRCKDLATQCKLRYITLLVTTLTQSTANEEWQHFQTLLHTTSRFRLSFIDCRCQLGMGQVGRVSACLGRTPDRFSIPRQRLMLKHVDDTNVRARSYYGKPQESAGTDKPLAHRRPRRNTFVKRPVSPEPGEARERPLEPVTRVYCGGSCCGIVLSAGAMSSLTLA